MEIFAVVAAILLAACCGVLSIALSQSRRHIAERTAELEAEQNFPCQNIAISPIYFFLSSVYHVNRKKSVACATS